MLKSGTEIASKLVRAGYLVIARCANLASSFLLFAILVRILPRSEIDLLALGLSWLVVLSVAFDFGVNEFFVRVIASNQNSSAHNLKIGLLTKTVLMALVSILFLTVSSIIYSDSHKIILLVGTIMAGATRSICDFSESAMIAAGDLRAVCIFALAQAILTLLTGVVVAHWMIAEAAPILFTQAIVCGVLAIPRLARLGCTGFRKDEIRHGIQQTPHLLRQCFPFGTMSVTASVSVAMPVIAMSLTPSMMSGMAPMQAAQRIWSTILALGQGPYTRLYANLSRGHMAQPTKT